MSRKKKKVPHITVGQIYDVYRVEIGVKPGPSQELLRRVEVVRVTATEATLRLLSESSTASNFAQTVKLATLRDRRAYRLAAVVANVPPPSAPTPTPEYIDGEQVFPRKDGRSPRLFKTGARIDDVRVGDTVEVRPTSARHRGKLALVTVIKVTRFDVVFDIGAQESGVRVHEVVSRNSFREPRFKVLLDLRPQGAPPPPRAATRSFHHHDSDEARPDDAQPTVPEVAPPSVDRVEEQLPLPSPVEGESPTELAHVRALLERLEAQAAQRNAAVAHAATAEQRAAIDDFEVALGALIKSLHGLREVLS